jgi:putative transposase
MGLRGRLSFTEEQFYFVTTPVVNHAYVFSEDIFCDILLKNIKHYQDIYHFIILGYVIMPTHFHWILKTEPEYGTLSDIMRDIKKYSAWDIMEKAEKLNISWMTELFKEAGNEFRHQKRKFWMPRFDDVVLRNQHMFYTKLNYVHKNPVKAGLVHKPEDYKYSSARNYIKGDHSVIFVDTSFY